MKVRELLMVIASGNVDMDAEVYYDTGEEELLIESAEADTDYTNTGIPRSLVLR